jgi:hypothetical protein
MSRSSSTFGRTATRSPGACLHLDEQVGAPMRVRAGSRPHYGRSAAWPTAPASSRVAAPTLVLPDPCLRAYVTAPKRSARPPPSVAVFAQPGSRGRRRETTRLQTAEQKSAGAMRTVDSDPVGATQRTTGGHLLAADRWPLYASSGSAGVDPAVTALVFAAPELQLAPRPTVGPSRLHAQRARFW